MENKLTGKSSLYIKILAISLALLSMAFSVFMYSRGHDKNRTLMYFPCYDGDGLFCEPRYFAKAADSQAAVTAFVNDLLLGPMTNRYSPIFPRGTKAEYCFISADDSEGQRLYLGLSRDALFAGDLLSVREGVDLLRLNIVKNFTYLNKIDVAIDGISVYE